MSFEQRGGEPTRAGEAAGKLFPGTQPEQPVAYEEEQVPDAKARRIRLIRHEVQVSTNAPARPKAFSYKCRFCRDQGVIDYVQEGVVHNRVIEYRFVARCFCKKSAEVSQKIPSYFDIFGEWPTP